MRLSIKHVTLIRLLKSLALTLLIILPILAFSFGMEYQKNLEEQKNPLPVMISPVLGKPNICTLDVKICPDGSTVGRVSPQCHFKPCPIGGKKVTCGGIAGKLCPPGYYCKYDGAHIDAAGRCEKDATNTGYACPPEEYVNCMPGPESRIILQCTTDYLRWAQHNCPHFKGAAY